MLPHPGLSLLFLSMPPKYFRPVMQVASCFTLTLYRSCIFLCVVPLPYMFKTLNAHAAAKILVGLLIHSPRNSLDSGSGITSFSILSSGSSGMS